MAKKLPTSIYRSLFVDAWRLTLERKPLWVFGIFAAVLFTGGVAEMTAKGFRNLVVIRDVYIDILHGTFTGAQVFGETVKQLTAFDPTHVTGTVTIFILFGVLVVIASIISQGALLAGCEKSAITDHDAYLVGQHAFWHLLPLNFFHKLAQSILTLFAAIPLLLVVEHSTTSDIFLSFTTLLIILPLTILFATIFILASINSVRTGNHSLDAIHHAMLIFRKHAVATIETGLFLFTSIILAIFVFLGIIFLASLPYAVLATIAVVSGSTFFFTLLNILGTLVLFFLLAMFAGATTTFQYTVWSKFYDHATTPKHKTISKLHRVWSGK